VPGVIVLDSDHETYLSTVQSQTRSHAWLSRSHEVARRPRRHQCATRQGSKTAVCLSPVAAKAAHRLVRPQDFDRALSAPAVSRTVHFALHHAARTLEVKLSTGGAPIGTQPVDNLARWLGIAVPRRYAKRSVTRTMLKRLVRHQFHRHAVDLAAGAWVVRLRAPFDPKLFVSAASTKLRHAAADELDALMKRAMRQRTRDLV